jgi:flagellar motor switch protein FliG
MNHVDRGNEKQIFDEMDKDNPELSKSIRDKMFMFENIIDMDPRSVQRFIRDCDSKDIVYALKTASEDMKNVFFANMSKRMAETVKGDLEITHDKRMNDCLPPILFSAIFKLLKVLPDTELDAC